MKKTITYLSLLFLFACTSNEKVIQQGQYDEAISNLVAKLEKHPSNSKAIHQLASAYPLANNLDLDYIKELKLSGQPDIWGEVHKTYEGLAARQESITGLSDEVKAQLDFTPEDYQAHLKESSQKACDYYYALANKNLSSGKPDDVSKALQCLSEIDKLNPDYKDVKELLAEFNIAEPVVVYYRVENKYPGELPSSMLNVINNINLGVFNRPGLILVDKKPKNGDYQYYAEVKIQDVLIAPEHTEEIYYTESADMQDGVAYKTDDKGNFLVNSSGEKIEIPKYKTIACYVSESVQHKSMMVSGTVELVDKESGKTIAVKNVSGETKFLHRSAQFKGDLNALLPETYELLGSRERAYPPDYIMVGKATEKLGRKAVDIIQMEIEKSRKGKL
jgi:tetratricopeptide (TPR) repeat protein